MLLGAVLARLARQEFQLQLSQKGCGAMHCPASGLPHAVVRGTKGREEQLKEVSRPGVAGFLPVKDSTNSAAFNLKAAFKVF